MGLFLYRRQICFAGVAGKHTAVELAVEMYVLSPEYACFVMFESSMDEALLLLALGFIIEYGVGSG